MQSINGVSKASYQWSQFIAQSGPYRLYPVSECDIAAVMMKVGQWTGFHAWLCVQDPSYKSQGSLFVWFYSEAAVLTFLAPWK